MGFSDRHAWIWASAGVAVGGAVGWRERRLRILDRDDLQQVAAEQAALHDIAMLVAAGASVDAVCDVVARSAVGLFGARVALVAQLAGGEELELRGLATTHGTDDCPSVGQRFSIQPGGAVADLVVTRRTARVLDGQPSSFYAGLGEHLATPIALGQDLWGVLAVGGSEAVAFSAGITAQLERFAGLVALAIGNAEARDQLVRQASSDPLTGLANARTYAQRLSSEIGRTRRHGRPLCLALMDIDHFKAINDSRGHLVGDEVLQEVADRLRAAVRSDVLLARVGGDEFAAVLPETTLEESRRLAERIRTAVAGAPLAADMAVSLSIGIAELHGDDSDVSVRHRADTALYAVKASGRNGVRSA